jgi:hypothetical protein
MPSVQTDYKSTLATNLTATGTTFDVAVAPTNTEGVLVIGRGLDNEEWIYMSGVSGVTITASHRGLSKTLGTPTEVTANKQAHYAGETVEWVNHTVHLINKQGDTVYGDLLMNSDTEMQFGDTDTAIWKDGSDNLSFKDANAGTKTLDSIASTSTKLDDFATPDDNTDLNATTSYHGLLPKLDGNTSNFLRGDGAFATPAGAGNISTSDSSATDNAIVREDGTTGTNVQKSLATIDDSGSINIPSGQEYQINGTALKDVTETLTNKTLTSPVINSPTGIVKADVGLGNVDNIADASQTSLGTVTSGNVDAIVPSNIYCILKLNTNLTLTAGLQYINWDNEVADASGFHTSGVNGDRLTVPTGQGGLYLINVFSQVNNTMAGGDTITYRIYNGATVLVQWIQSNNLSTNNTYVASLSAGDIIRVGALSSVAYVINGGSNDEDRAYISMHKLT